MLEILRTTRTLLLACLTDEANGDALSTANHLAASPAAWVRALHAQAVGKKAQSASPKPASGGAVNEPAATSAVDARASEGVNDSPLWVDRTAAWLEDTANRLRPLLARVCAAASHGSWRSRDELVRMARLLLLKCTLSLQPCVPMLLEHLYACTRDAYPRVARASRSALRAVGARLPSSAALASIVRDGLEAQLRALPALVRGVGEGAKARTFGVLSAQIELVDASGGLGRLLSARLGALCAALLSAGAMGTQEGRAIEVRAGLTARVGRQRRAPSAMLAGSSPTESEAALHLRHARYSPWPFAHLRESKTVDAAAELCAQVGARGGLTSLAHQLLLPLTASVAQGGTPPRAEALWVLDCVLRGAADAQRQSRGVSAGDDDARVESDAEAEVEAEGDAEAEAEAVKAAEAGAAADDASAGVAPFTSRAASCMGSAEVEECVDMLLSELLDPAVWHAPSAVGQTGSIARQHATITEHEALLRVVGSAFELLAAAAEGAEGGVVGGGSRPAVQVALRRMLFPLLERLGDESLALSTAAELTLCRVCAALGDAAIGSVADLLQANSDFLLDALCGRLRRASHFPHTARVVQAVLDYGGEVCATRAPSLSLSPHAWTAAADVVSNLRASL